MMGAKRGETPRFGRPSWACSMESNRAWPRFLWFDYFSVPQITASQDRASQHAPPSSRLQAISTLGASDQDP